MKYLVLLCDGMSDTKNDILDGRTPMEAADKPCMDMLASKGEVGLLKTVADGLKPEAMLPIFRFLVTTHLNITQAVLPLRPQI